MTGATSTAVLLGNQKRPWLPSSTATTADRKSEAAAPLYKHPNEPKLRPDQTAQQSDDDPNSCKHPFQNSAQI